MLHFEKYSDTTCFGILKFNDVFAVLLYLFWCLFICLIRSFSLVNIFLLYTILLSSLWLLSTFPFCYGEYGIILLTFIFSFCATFSNVLVLSVLSPSFTNSYPLSTCIVFILNPNLFSSSIKIYLFRMCFFL